MQKRRLTAGVLLIGALAGCAGSHSASSTSQPRATTSAKPARLNALQPMEAAGTISGGGQVRVSQRSRTAPAGTSVALLAVPGVGTLRARCSATPGTRFALTSWARGEGPPVVQHTRVVSRHPVALIPLGPLQVPPVGGTGAPDTYDQWQIGVFSEAFSGTATVWSVIAPGGGHCEMAAQALLVTHGAWSRYAPKHG